MPVVDRRPFASTSLNARPIQRTRNSGAGYKAVGESRKSEARARGQKAQYEASKVKAIASIVSTVASAAGSVAKYAEAEQAKADNFDFKIKATEFGGNNDLQYNQSKTQLSGDGNEWRSNRLATFEQNAKKFLDSLPKSKQQEGQLFIARQRAALDNKSFSDVQVYRQKWAFDQTKKVLDNQVLPNIGDDPDQNVEYLGKIDQLIDGSDVASPQVKNQLRAHAVKQVYDRWLKAAGPNASETAKEIIARYKFNPSGMEGIGTEQGQNTVEDAQARKDVAAQQLNDLMKNREGMSLEEYGKQKIILGEAFTEAQNEIDRAQSRKAAEPTRNTSVPLSSGQAKKLRGVRQDVVAGFSQLQQRFGQSLQINSAHRTAAHNAAVGGAKGSQHVHGNAIDINVRGFNTEDRLRLIRQASALGFNGIGVYPNAIHIDKGGRRAWGPNYSSNSVPRWAQSTIRQHLGGAFHNKGTAPAFNGQIKIIGDRVDSVSFAQAAISQVASSRLNGFVPKDGAQFGITTGSPREWARFFTMLLRQESGGRIARVGRDGSLQRFRTTPRGENSFGPLQFNRGEYGLKTWQDVNDPGKNIGALIRVGERFTLRSGYIRNGQQGYDAYFGSVRRPNEVLQHSRYANKVLAQVGNAQRVEIEDNRPGQPPTGNTIHDQFVRKLFAEEKNIEAYSEQMERRQEIETARVEREQEKETVRTGLELFHKGELTKEWLEDNAGKLPNSMYDRFMTKLNSKVARVTDPEIYTGLLERSDTSPEDVINEASEAYKNGQLSKSAFDKIYAKATRELNPKSSAPAWVKEQRSLLKSQLRPSSDATPEQRQAYTNSLEQFDNYVEKNGQEFDRKELQTYTESLIKQRKTNQIQDARNGLAMPTHTSVGREAMTLEEVQATRIKLLGELKAGNITREEAGKQWQLLKQWQKMLETSGDKVKPAIPNFTRGLQLPTGQSQVKGVSETVPSTVQHSPIAQTLDQGLANLPMDGAVEAVQNQVLGAAAGWIQNFVQQTGLPQQMVEQLVMQVVGATANQMSGQTPLVTGEPGRPFDNAAAYQAAAQNVDALGAAGVAAAGAPARAAAIGARTRQASGVTAYHGSPHDFDKFSMDKIGTGEGAQAYGHGLYFADNPKVANEYRKNLALRHRHGESFTWKDAGAEKRFRNTIEGLSDNVAGRNYIENNAISQLAQAEGDVSVALKNIDEKIAGYKKSGTATHLEIAEDLGRVRQAIQNHANDIVTARPGNVYEVNIKANKDDFLDWDKPFDQQSARVREVLNQHGVKSYQELEKKVSDPPPDESGMAGWTAIRNTVNDAFIDPRRSQEILKEAGIPGIKYKDAGSRGAEGGTYNYVIFDDSLIEIVKKNGIPFKQTDKGFEVNEAGMKALAALQAKQSEGDE